MTGIHFVLWLSASNLVLGARRAEDKVTESDTYQLHASMARTSCETWCANKYTDGIQTWETLCGWTKCAACDECTDSDYYEYWQSPYYAMTCSGTQILTTASMTYAQYDAAAASVVSLYNSLEDNCTATYCPQADFAGCVLRIAGHDFMDFKDSEGGSDGCIDFHDTDNAGLSGCIHLGDHGVSLADAYVNFCTTISLADFFVIAAEAVMNVTRQHVLDDDSSRSWIDFRSNFRYGRTTAKSCEFAEGRLPNPENSCSAVEETFVTSMGLNWAQSAALMGVHTLGRADIANSGYNGWWSDANNSRKFNNNYFTSIVLKGWAPEASIDGNAAKNQWQRVDSGVDEANLGKEMMLNTDMCLYFTMDDAGAVDMDASTALTNECNCTWVSAVFFDDAITKYNDDKFCGSTTIHGSDDFPAQRALCCGDDFDTVNDAWVDCGLPVSPEGPAHNKIKEYANDEDAWISSFLNAWRIATTNGFSLRSIQN